MTFEFDLSLIVCPTCNRVNDKMLIVIGKHEFYNSYINETPLYEILCQRCKKLFIKRVSLSITEK